MTRDMREAGKGRKHASRVTKYALLLAAGWTLVIIASLVWNYFHEQDGALTAARVAARAQFAKDVIYRRWNAGYGGVYVPISDSCQPNPHLADVEERDIETPSGRRLTLINPAYMARQVHELGWQAEGIRGHITSLNPIRLANAADPWEKVVLGSFERGEREFASVESLDGKSHLRLMRPLVTEKGCLKCHAKQGYKEGDIRGGISMSMPMAPYTAIMRKNTAAIGVGHGVLWLLGLVALTLGARNIWRRERERKRAEVAREREQEFMQTVIDGFPEGLMVVNHDYTIALANRMICDMAGEKDPVAACLKCHQISHKNESPCEDKEHSCPLRQVIETCAPVTVEHLHYDARGQEIAFEITAAPIFDASGEVVQIIESYRNITERRRAEEARKKLLHDMGERVKELQCMYSVAESIRTRTTLEEIFHDVAELIPPAWHYPEITRGKVIFDGKKYVSEPFEETRWKQSGDIIMNGEFRGLIEVYYLEERPELDEGPFMTEERNLIDGMARNISEAIERKQAEEALIESERHYQELFSSVMEGIGIVDENETIKFVNPAFVKIFGENSANDMLGKNLLDYFSESQKNIILSETDKRKTGDSSQYELEITTAEGMKKHLHVSITPRFNKNNEYRGAYGSVLDITETRRLKDLESRAQRLKTAGQIAGQVAHDFNNLLAPLVAYPEFIRDGLPENHSVLTFLDDMENSARKIADINQQLLTLGRRGHYNQELFNLNELVEQAIKELEAVPDTLSIKTDLDLTLMNTKGGKAQLYRVLINLLNNARDATRDTGEIYIKTENWYIEEDIDGYNRIPVGEYARASITDKGCGIPEDVQHKIFDPFYTSKSTDKKRGSGLGLSIVDSVVKDHGGFIDLDSTVGEGTTFHLYFPIARDVRDKNEQVQPMAGSEKMLVVDDDEIQRQVTSRLLKKLGYQVVIAESGNKAIELVRENSYDLILLDMIMPPGIDGVETFKRIREIKSDQKAIIVSGFSETDQVMKAKSMGVGAFVKKPLTKKTLMMAVRRELDRKNEPVVS
ncbi:MAG: ATP-binding protein [candidate division Zixibacteria bacterium]